MSDRVAAKVPGLMDDPKKRPPMDHGTTFWGEDGWISVSRGALYASPKSLQTAHIRDDERPVIRSTSQGRNFVESMRTRKPTVNPLESAIRSDTISHMSDIAIRLGRPITWDPVGRADRRRRRGLQAPRPSDAPALDALVSPVLEVLVEDDGDRPVVGRLLDEDRVHADA